MSKPLTRKERAIAATYRRLQKAQERAALQYELADRLSFSIAQKAGGHGHVVRINAEGKAIQVIDNYQAAIAHPKREPAQMPKAWAHGSVRQFELKETSIPLEAAE
jgi:hypothetical protein